ncbi:MAG TPA: trehalose-phosphatase [Burkholderiales bacterium]|jgi:trehalose 6-phosphate phosphatase|nr:trehalose-phosphatase [Burkholderiales bacterium]
MTSAFRIPVHDADAGGSEVPLPEFSRDWALFLDVDGTLVELAEHPRAVHVEPPLIQQLGRLQRLAGGAVALVSGRSVIELDRLFTPLHLAIAGQHGAEIRHANGKTDLDRPRTAAAAAARRALAALAESQAGLYFEDKGVALAVHYRRAPQLGPLVERTLSEVARQSRGEFVMQTGKMVRELVPHGKSKGGAIAAFMREPPFAGRLPVFLGDDVTDEGGFAVVSQLSGHAIKVGTGNSAALYRVAGVRSVRRWLGAFADWLEKHAH